MKKIDKELLKSFIEKPYVIVPKDRDRWYVIAPRFLDIQFGWLER